MDIKVNQLNKPAPVEQQAQQQQAADGTFKFSRPFPLFQLKSESPPRTDSAVCILWDLPHMR